MRNNASSDLLYGSTVTIGKMASAVMLGRYHSSCIQGSIKTTEGDEERQQDVEEGSKEQDSRSVVGIISVLLIGKLRRRSEIFGAETLISHESVGVFISQADSSLMLATYGRISSEFNDLESGSWLMISYMLAQCVAQPFVSLGQSHSCLELGR